MTNQTVFPVQTAFSSLNALIATLSSPYRRYQRLRVVEWLLYLVTAIVMAATQSWLIHVSRPIEDDFALLGPLLVAGISLTYVLKWRNRRQLAQQLDAFVPAQQDARYQQDYRAIRQAALKPTKTTLQQALETFVTVALFVLVLPAVLK